jgi:hypothetical protein
MNPHHAALARNISISQTWMIVAVAGALAIGAPARAEVSADDAKATPNNYCVRLGFEGFGWSW